MDFTKGDLAKSQLIKYLEWFSVTFYIYLEYAIGDIYPSFDAFF